MGKQYKIAKNGRPYCLETVNGKRRSRFVTMTEYNSKGKGKKGAGFHVGGGLKKVKRRVRKAAKATALGYVAYRGGVGTAADFVGRVARKGVRKVVRKARGGGLKGKRGRRVLKGV